MIYFSLILSSNLIYEYRVNHRSLEKFLLTNLFNNVDDVLLKTVINSLNL